MARGVGEFIVQQANKRGAVLFVDLDNRVKYYPEFRDKQRRQRLLSDEFLRVLNRYYYHVKHFLISDAVSA